MENFVVTAETGFHKKRQWKKNSWGQPWTNLTSFDGYCYGHGSHACIQSFIIANKDSCIQQILILNSENLGQNLYNFLTPLSPFTMSTKTAIWCGLCLDMNLKQNMIQEDSRVHILEDGAEFMRFLFLSNRICCRLKAGYLTRFC